MCEGLSDKHCVCLFLTTSHGNQTWTGKFLFCSDHCSPGKSVSSIELGIVPNEHTGSNKGITPCRRQFSDGQVKLFLFEVHLWIRDHCFLHSQSLFWSRVAKSHPGKNQDFFVVSFTEDPSCWVWNKCISSGVWRMEDHKMYLMSPRCQPP